MEEGGGSSGSDEMAVTRASGGASTAEADKILTKCFLQATNDNGVLNFAYEITRYYIMVIIYAKGE